MNSPTICGRNVFCNDNMKTNNYILLLVAFAISIASTAQDTIRIDSLTRTAQDEIQKMDGIWHYLNGVDSNWNEIDDRSNWGTSKCQFDLDTLDATFSGSAWFSKTIWVADSLKGSLAAFTVETNGGAMEIFLNEKRIGKYGTPSSDPSKEKAEVPLYQDLVVFQFDTTNIQRIDVRLSNHQERDHIDFGLTLTSIKNGTGLMRFLTSAFSGSSMLFFGSYFAFSLIHLMLFFFYKEDRSNLFYGLSTVAIALFFLFYLADKLVSDPEVLFFLQGLMKLMGFFSAYFVLRLLYNLFYEKAPIWHWAFFALLIVSGSLSWFPGTMSNVFTIVFSAGCAVEFIRIIFQIIRQRKPGGRNISIGILCMVIGIVVFALSQLANEYYYGSSGNHPPNFIIAVFTLMLLIASLMMFYSIPLSMSLFISRKSAETNESLKLQLVKVEELSAETIRQERDKQKILEGQKEMLETEVRNQTKEIREQHEVVKKERDRSEELLLNILPEQVAEELKEKGEAEAQLIDQVTVLFTDFKGFTAMSEVLTAKDLVSDLNECFSEFDRIVGKYGIEKIKTIGDAYMAAGGLPIPNDTHAQDVIKAAFEMRAFVEAGKAKKIEQGLPYFEIRIGIHTGPVVAGIVGVKKFQYDIWGDTVNTASRMESSGEVGKVNISQATYELLKDDSEFTFKNRGKIEAKGKGEMEMWFVSLL